MSWNISHHFHQRLTNLEQFWLIPRDWITFCNCPKCVSERGACLFTHLSKPPPPSPPQAPTATWMPPPASSPPPSSRSTPPRTNWSTTTSPRPPTPPTSRWSSRLSWTPSSRRTWRPCRCFSLGPAAVWRLQWLVVAELGVGGGSKKENLEGFSGLKPWTFLKSVGIYISVVCCKIRPWKALRHCQDFVREVVFVYRVLPFCVCVCGRREYLLFAH